MKSVFMSKLCTYLYEKYFQYKPVFAFSNFIVMHFNFIFHPNKDGEPLPPWLEDPG